MKLMHVLLFTSVLKLHTLGQSTVRLGHLQFTSSPKFTKTPALTLALQLNEEDSTNHSSSSLYQLLENTKEIIKDVTIDTDDGNKLIITTSLNTCSNLSLFIELMFETSHENAQYKHRKRSPTFYYTATMPCKEVSALDNPMVAVASGACLALSLVCAVLALLCCQWHRRGEHVVKEEVNATYGQGGDYQESTVSDTNVYYKK